MPKKKKLPSAPEFLHKKVYHGPKPEPLWIRLERDMKEKAEKKEKPYNEVVGEWLKYLKDLKQYQHDQEKRKYNRLDHEVGPPWFTEFTTFQKDVIKHITYNIHSDLIENLPRRTKKSLAELGITANFPKKMLLDAMKESEGDAGVFMWKLYTAYYKTPPSELRSEYDMNAKLMMSSLVFVDIKECIKTMDNMTKSSKKPDIEKPSKPKKKAEQAADPYLQSPNRGKIYSNNRSEEEIAKPEEPPPLNYSLRVKSETLAKRKERNLKEKFVVRQAKYKFWEPPSTLRNKDPEQVAYINKCKMLTKKAERRFETPFENMQFHIGTVAYTGGKPIYLLNNVAYLPTGYYPINGGNIFVNGEMVTNVLGYWKYPDDTSKTCDTSCDCIAKWENKVLDYLKNTKCRHRHHYDFYNTGEVKEKYFYPATRHGTMAWDLSKVYQFDSTEDFIKKTVDEALLSKEESETKSTNEHWSHLMIAPTPPILKVSELEDNELVGIFLADLANSPLIIPHLPLANKLGTLLEWTRKRVKGELSPAQHKKIDLKCQRRWMELEHINFRARAFRIPFAADELKNLTWSHRGLIQKLYENMVNDFVTRNRENQLRQARLFWGTMHNDKYPSKSFLDTFFSYMPSRQKDLFLIRPYSPDMVPIFGGRTCPLLL